MELGMTSIYSPWRNHIIVIIIIDLHYRNHHVYIYTYLIK